MDRATRIYAFVLTAVVLALLYAVYYQPENVRELNSLLQNDAQLTDYAYPFRVLRVQNGVAEMSTPRSVAMPVENMIAAVYPALKNAAVESPEFQKAQQDLAEHQARAKQLVLREPGIDRVIWKLDKNWLYQQGVQTVP